MNNIITEIRSVQNFTRAIISEVCVNKADMSVEINVTTDCVFTSNEEASVEQILKKHVPTEFFVRVNVTKLSPDCDMIKSKIYDHIEKFNKVIFSVITPNDVHVEKTEKGFLFSVAVLDGIARPQDTLKKISDFLETVYCGKFEGQYVDKKGDLTSIELEEEHENVEYAIPIRSFQIANFSNLEGTETVKRATYICDLNFISESVVVCGKIEDVIEKSYTNKRGEEKPYLVFAINDTTATTYATCFLRKKNEEKIKALKVGDSIVCTGATEQFRGRLNFTIKTIDFGTIPDGFVPEKQISKPVPKFYTTVKPQPFTDFVQAELFRDDTLPDCLKNNVFVSIDLETTGLKSVPTDGDMDKIIEIGAYKIKDGNICESFTTFINPQCKLTQEITELTGITQDMVADAPTYDKVMPDLFKFCDGAYLVGHNIAGFDFRFINFYCAKMGYFFERKLFDTYALGQELLRLGNYKLNTLADHFGFTFNHHRAADDALVTAKVFMELIKIKKSLPKLS